MIVRIANFSATLQMGDFSFKHYPLLYREYKDITLCT